MLAFLLSHWLLSNGGCSTTYFPAHDQDQQRKPKFDRLREQMVRDQLRGRDITDTGVLAAMLKIPRHEFVPGSIVESAYDDSALPLRLGQTISQPYIVAYMTQALQLHGTERVLEIGTGSGYQSAVLSELASEVYTIEIIRELSRDAMAILTKLGYKNIYFRIGDGYVGWPEFAPFDRIIVTAAPEHVPQPLVDQLKVGGRMVIPVGRGEQELIVLEKGESGITRRTTIPVRFVPMTGKSAEHGA